MFAYPDPTNPFNQLFDRAKAKGWYVELSAIEALYREHPGVTIPGKLWRVSVLDKETRGVKAFEPVGENLKAASSKLIGRLGLS